MMGFFKWLSNFLFSTMYVNAAAWRRKETPFSDPSGIMSIWPEEREVARPPRATMPSRERYISAMQNPFNYASLQDRGVDYSAMLEKARPGFDDPTKRAIYREHDMRAAYRREPLETY